MGKSIESDALDRVYRTLGLSGGAQPSGTLLDDGNVSQVLSLNQIIRRSRTPAGSTGWYRCALSNVHTDVEILQSSISPYAAGGSAIAPFPALVPAGFDFYILDASVRRVSGTGALTAGYLLLQPLAIQGGFGQDDSGAAVANTDDAPLALWVGLNTDATMAAGLSITGEIMQHIGLRIPRGALVKWQSESGATATFRLYLHCALFAEGLGQDVGQ